MVNVLLSRKVESNNLESNNYSKMAKKHTELPVFVEMLDIKQLPLFELFLLLGFLRLGNFIF